MEVKTIIKSKRLFTIYQKDQLRMYRAIDSPQIFLALDTLSIQQKRKQAMKKLIQLQDQKLIMQEQKLKMDIDLKRVELEKKKTKEQELQRKIFTSFLDSSVIQQSFNNNDNSSNPRNKPNYRKLSTQEKQNISKQILDKNLNDVQISKMFGVSRRTVRKYRIKLMRDNHHPSMNNQEPNLDEEDDIPRIISRRGRAQAEFQEKEEHQIKERSEKGRSRGQGGIRRRGRSQRQAQSPKKEILIDKT